MAGLKRRQAALAKRPQPLWGVAPLPRRRMVASNWGLRVAFSMSLQLPGCVSSGMHYAPSTPYFQAATVVPAKLRLLLRHLVRQQTDSACSVAATGTILGAVLEQRGRPAPSQQDILRTDPSGGWALATATAQSSGVGLTRLAFYLLQAMRSFGLKNVSVDVVPVSTANNNSMATLLHDLAQNEQQPTNHFIILNFVQAVYLQDGDAVGHMSVVGAYDAAQQRALVLDVDYAVPQPYWVPLPVLLQGMASADMQTGGPRGYLVVRIAA